MGTITMGPVPAERLDLCPGCGKDKIKLFHACHDCFRKGAYWSDGQLKFGEPLPWNKE